MKKNIPLIIFLILIKTIGAFAQTNLDSEPANNTVPGDSLGLPANNNATNTGLSDLDHFKIKTSKIGVLTISVNGVNSSMITRIHVITADGISLEAYRDAAFAGDDVSIDILTKYVGIYYIKVQNRGSGSTSSGYNLKITMDTSDVFEFNNTIASLSGVSPMSISSNESAPTVINAQLKGYHYVNNGGNYGFVNLTADQDIYKITTGSKMGVLVMKLSNAATNLKFRMEMIAADGSTPLGYKDASINGDSLRFELLTQYAGNYYIRLWNNNGFSNTSSKQYTLSISLDTTGNEYNDNIALLSSLSSITVSLNESSPTVIKARLRGHSYINNGGSFDFNNLNADQDYYKITTGKNKGALLLKLTSVPTNLKFRIEMIKDDGITLLGYRDAAFNGDTLKFELLTQYEGIYYIRLRNVNGVSNNSGNTSSTPYLLAISLDTLGTEYNDNIVSVTAKTPVSVSLNESNPTMIMGKIRGYYYVNNGGSYDFASLAADQDYYKITSGNNQGVLVLKLTVVPVNLRFRIEVIKDDGSTILGYRDASFNGDSLKFELLMQYSGVYYIRVRNVNNSANGNNNSSPLAYTLTLALDTSGNEFNDLASVLTANPIKISLNESSPTIIQDKIRGYFYTNNGGSYDFPNLSADQDYCKITTVKNTGVLVMKLSSVPTNLRMRIEVIKEDGTTLLGYRDASINGDTLRFELLTLYAGIYYIRLRNVNGNPNGTSNSSALPYTFNISLDTLGDEFNDNIISVTNLVPVPVGLSESSGTTIKGRIRGYYYLNNGGNYDFASLTADQDIYKISTSQTGVLVMKFAGFPINLKFRIEVIKDDGLTSLGYRDAVANGDTAIFDLLTHYAGTYYIRLRNVNTSGNGTGNSSALPYVFKLFLETGLGELNESIATASDISVNDSVYGKISGYYRTNFGSSSGAEFFSLTLDDDVYKINNGCYHFKSATLAVVPKNLRMKINAYDTAGIFLGSKTATNDGELVTLSASNLTDPRIVKYLEVESNTTSNDINSSRDFYVMYTSFRDTIYAPSITPGITKPCMDSILILNSNSTENNHWSTGETTKNINYLVKKSEFVTLRLHTTGCFSGIDTSFIQVLAPPVSSFNYSRNLKVISFTNNSPTATSFKWDFGDGKTSTIANPIHTYAIYDTFKVSLTVSNRCGLDSSKQSLIVASVGINDVKNTGGLFIYPNPNNGHFQIEFEQPLPGKADLEILSSIGQKVMTRVVEAGAKQVNLRSELPDGVYVVMVTGESFKMTRRVVVRQ